MRKLKLSLKKEVISDLESKEVKGGATVDCYSANRYCRPRTREMSICVDCSPTQQRTCRICEE